MVEKIEVKDTLTFFINDYRKVPKIYVKTQMQTNQIVFKDVHYRDAKKMRRIASSIRSREIRSWDDAFRVMGHNMQLKTVTPNSIIRK